MALCRLCKPLRHWFKTLTPRSLDTKLDGYIVSFADLPPEIIHHIGSFLPAASGAALALCNHKFSSVLGTQYWKALGSWGEGGGRKPEEIGCISSAMTEVPLENPRSDFLTLLERDLPDYIFCRHCALLDLPIFGLGTQYGWHRFCVVADKCSSTLVGHPAQTRFSLLQWTMKRHRMGLDCGKELDYLFVERPFQNDSSISGYSRYSIKETRIRHGKVLMRAQEWLLLPASHIGPLPELTRTDICSHL